MKIAILWFRNDLRIDDHPALSMAMEKAGQVVPVYVLDPRQYGTDRWGIERMGPFRRRFLRESLTELRGQLASRGSSLRILLGYPEEAIPRLAERYGANTVFAHREAATEEQNVESALSARINLALLWGSTLYHPDDLPFEPSTIPDIFTDFRKAVENSSRIRQVYPAPGQIPGPPMTPEEYEEEQFLETEHVNPDSRAAMTFTGGSSAAYARMRHYFWDTRALSRYQETRNGLIGQDYSSKLSPWLANGSISAGQIYWEIKRFEKEVVSNISTYWLIFELIWRDFFWYTALKYGPRIFQSSGINGVHKSWRRDSSLFRTWCSGRTGDRFVDANMLELALTGWMSNRGRQNVASFLAHDLQLDWRMGAAWFESMLIDYDPCSNYGNWMYVAGVGNDPRVGRKYNTARQAELYDPEGTYRALWLDK